MGTQKYYDTVSEAITDLAKRGYTTDFAIEAEKDCLVCRKTSLELSAEDFQLDEVHRFEGMTDPGDEMVVYAISSDRFKAKGTVVNAYGPYANATSSKIVARLTKQ